MKFLISITDTAYYYLPVPDAVFNMCNFVKNQKVNIEIHTISLSFSPVSEELHSSDRSLVAVI